MVLEEISAITTSWNLLQQPVHPGSGVSASFRSLLAAVDQGWQVEAPVQVRRLFPMSPCTYEFFLTHPLFTEAIRLTVPEAPAVRRFLDQHIMQVIEDGGC